MQDAQANAVLPDDLGICQQMIRELVDTVGDLRSTIEKLEAHNHYLARMLFGRRSERVNPDQLLLFADPEPTTEPEPTPPPVEKVVVKRKGHGRKPKPKDLPRETVVLDVTEAEKLCPCCGAAKVCIGNDVSEKIDYRPASAFRREIQRPIYICRGCEQKGENIQAVQAPLPPEPIPGGTAAAGMLAHVFVSKYWDHLPLYRLESILGRLGWDVSRKTLCGQLMACATLLTPLYDWMVRRVKQSYALHADDTSIVLLSPRRTAHAWVYVGDAANPYTVFDLSVGRAHEFPEKFLAKYKGYIHADGYTGYNALYAAGATHVGCWMHVRRYFFEAKQGDPVNAHEALARIRALYAVEADAQKKKLTGEDLATYRQEHAGPLLVSFAEWLAEHVPRALPKSKIGEAFNYASNQWPTLTRYLADGRLNIDNGPAERAVRPLAVGRRNWLHIGGTGGLRSGAVLLSIAASARRQPLNAWEYVKHILTEMPKRAAGADLTDLLPDEWAKARAGSPALAG